jgi:hypothetical protein
LPIEKRVIYCYRKRKFFLREAALTVPEWRSKPDRSQIQKAKRRVGRSSSEQASPTVGCHFVNYLA